MYSYEPTARRRPAGSRNRRGVSMPDSYAEFTVRGVSSEEDVQTITDELQELEGVQMVEIDVESGRAEARYGESLLSEVDIESAVAEAGYEVE
jgi:copper chaperone CopZ